MAKSDNEQPLPSAKKAEFCSSCKDLMNGIDNLKALLQPGGVRLCSGPGQQDRCALRAISLASVRAWNDRHPKDKLLDDRDPSINVVALLKKGEKKGSHDITQLALRQRCDETSVDLLRLSVRAVSGDPAAEFISGRGTELRLASTETFKKIHQWSHACSDSHVKCPKPVDTVLPTRLLDVGLDASAAAAQVRVQNTRGQKGKYVALSYCWGGPQEVSLTTKTSDSMHACIGLASLPQTLQDAVLVTRKLGLRYLWIDALCIVQDSQADKDVELAQMAHIYKYAAYTISAASSRAVGEGFLQDKALRYPRFALPFRAWHEDEERVGSVWIQESYLYDAFVEPINFRAWTLQERLLSPRLLIYGSHELVWQCQTKSESHGGAIDFYDAGNERLEAAFFIDKPSSSSDDVHLSEEDFWYSWIDVVMDYSHRELTVATDKLVALSGVASEFQRLSNGDQYLAGLWRRTLLKDLMWMVDPTNERGLLRRRTNEYVAPSWSWASVQGVVSFSAVWDTGTASKPLYVDLVEAQTTVANPDLPTGAVVSGLLRLRGGMVRGFWRRAQSDFGRPAPESVDLLDEKRHAVGKVFFDAVDKVFFDAVDNQVEEFQCLRLGDMNGLVLLEQENSVFRRIGFFETRGPKGMSFQKVCDEFFRGSKGQTVTIL